VISQSVYASFPWYDLPEMHAATNAFYLAVRGALEAREVHDAPASLDRERPHGTDRDGACFFTQTCGYPLFTTARDHFTVLGAPWYAVPGCDAALHRSFIVVRDGSRYHALEDLRGARFAVNEPDSNSGMNLPRRLFAPFAKDGRFFSSVVVSGSHVRSAAAVGADAVDAAAIDCVTYALLRRYRPQAVRSLRVVGETATTPTPPFVTSTYSGRALAATLRDAIRDVLADPRHAATREALFLDGMTACETGAYDVVMRYETEAVALGYPVLG
jgi:ABC-type phosphate/phosphonate transport system substrate-binding protein